MDTTPNQGTGTIQQYEIGKRKVTIEKLMNIAFALRKNGKKTDAEMK